MNDGEDLPPLTAAQLKETKRRVADLRVCQAYDSDPYAQRYQFWKRYAERRLT